MRALAGKRFGLLGAIAVAIALAGCSLTGHHHPASPRQSQTGSSPQPFLRQFAAAYVGVLSGAQSPASLPWSTPAARANAQPIPASDQLGAPQLLTIHAQAGSSAVFTLAIADGPKHLYATVTLGRQGGRWVATDLRMPDYAQVFQPPAKPQVVPAAARPALRAIRSFLSGYVPCTYGRARCTRAPGATPGLQAQLASITVPASLRGQHAVISPPTMQRTQAGWTAFADVRDPRSSYVVTVSAARIQGRWMITNVS